MISVLVAALASLLVSILCTPIAIRLFRRQGFGQEIRDDGPQSHRAKRGTPTMGGAVIIVATLFGYAVAHLLTADRGPSASGLLLLYLFAGLGIVGFLDDFIKIRRQRNLGLNKTSKLVGQLVTAFVFGVLAIRFANAEGLTRASDTLSFVRYIAVL